jgi:hypothetical protein
MSKFLAADNLPAWFPLHHFNRPVYNYKTGVDVVDWNKKSLWAFIGMVAFNPIFWNIVARNGASAYEPLRVPLRDVSCLSGDGLLSCASARLGRQRLTCRVPQQDDHKGCALALPWMLHPRRDHLLPLRLPGQPVSGHGRRP